MGKNRDIKSRKKEYKRARRRATRPWKILTWISAPITAILIVLAVFCSIFDNSLSIFVGGTFNNIKNKDENAVYYKMDFDSQEEMVHYGEQLCKRVEEEGAALLLNENDALPLAEGAKVSCFSTSSKPIRAIERLQQPQQPYRNVHGSCIRIQ